MPRRWQGDIPNSRRVLRRLGNLRPSESKPVSTVHGSPSGRPVRRPDSPRSRPTPLEMAWGREHCGPQPSAGRPAPQWCDRRVRRWGEPSAVGRSGDAGPVPAGWRPGRRWAKVGRKTPSGRPEFRHARPVRTMDSVRPTRPRGLETSCPGRAWRISWFAVEATRLESKDRGTHADTRPGRRRLPAGGRS
jgi:hypothetical protein